MFRPDWSKDLPDLLMNNKDSKKRETRVSWARPYWWMPEDTFLREMFFYMPIGSKIYLAGDKPSKEEMLFSLSSFGNVPWGTGAYLHEKIHSLQEPHMPIKRAAYLILLARNKNPKGELSEAQAYRAFGAPIDIITAEELSAKIQEFKMDGKKKAYPYIKPERFSYALHAMDQLNALGMSQKEIAALVRRSPSRWDNKRNVYPDVQEVIDAEMAKRELDIDGLNVLVDTYRDVKRSMHEKVRTIAQEILQRYEGNVSKSEEDRTKKEEFPFDYNTVSLRPLRVRLTDKMLERRANADGREYVIDLYENVTQKEARDQRRKERLSTDEKLFAEINTIASEEDLHKAYERATSILSNYMLEGIYRLDGYNVSKYIRDGFENMSKKEKKKWQKRFQKHPIEQNYLKTVDGATERYSSNIWPDKRAMLHSFAKDGALPIQAQRYIHGAIDEMHKPKSLIGKLFSWRKKGQELKEAQAYRASFLPTELASRTELASYMVNATDNKGRKIHKNLNPDRLIFAIDAIDFFNAFGVSQEDIAKIIRRPGGWDKYGKRYRGVWKEMKKRVSRLDPVTMLDDLEFYEKSADIIKMPDIMRKVVIEDAMRKLDEQESNRELARDTLDRYKYKDETQEMAA